MLFHNASERPLDLITEQDMWLEGVMVRIKMVVEVARLLW